MYKPVKITSSLQEYLYLYWYAASQQTFHLQHLHHTAHSRWTLWVTENKNIQPTVTE